MNEHAVMAIIDAFKGKYLKNQQLMGFAVMDEDRGILVASTFDQSYGNNLTNPVKSWVVYEGPTGIQAFEMKEEDDFRNFVFSHLDQAASA